MLCKSGERVMGPMLIHAFKDAVKDSFATVASSKSAHFTDAPAHFDKQSFNDVRGADPFPVLF